MAYFDPMEAAATGDTAPEEFSITAVSSTITDLIEACREGRRSFETAADAVDDRSVAERLRKLGEQREEMVAELHNAGNRYGVWVESSGSLGEDLRRGWIRLKGAATSGDRAVLEAIEAAEDRVVQQYEGVLAHELPTELRELLERHYHNVTVARDEVRWLLDEVA